MKQLSQQKPNAKCVRLLNIMGKDKKIAPLLGNYFRKCRHRPIFPGRFQPSIFGTNELNYRVRNGNGWTLTVINTDYVISTVTGTAQIICSFAPLNVGYINRLPRYIQMVTRSGFEPLLPA